MASGFFLISSYEKNKKRSAISYIANRYKRLYPMYLLAFIVVFLIIRFRGVITYEASWHFVLELTLLQNCGVPHGSGLNYPAWFLSVLIVASFVVYILLHNLPRKLYNAIAIMIITGVYIYLAICGNMNSWEYEFKIFYMPIWRGLAGLLSGTLIYQISSKIKWPSRISNIFTVIAFCSINVLIFMNINSDWIITILFMLLLFAVADGNTFLEKLGKTRLIEFLDSYEYPMYLIQIVAIMIARRIYGFLHIDGLMLQSNVLILILFICAVALKLLLTIIMKIMDIIKAHIFGKNK